VNGPTLSIIWVLSLALFAMRQIRFWAKRRPLAISVAAWLLYVALVYLRIVPSHSALAAGAPLPGAVKRRQAKRVTSCSERSSTGSARSEA
jgi:hypothetical protein